MRVAVALGSNLGDRLANLRLARGKIEQIPGVKAPFLASAIYETRPVGCEPGAGDFLNAVIEFEYDGDPAALLRSLAAAEVALGRPAGHRRNVSRIIDFDILYAGDIERDDDGIQLPHPRLHERRFVLQPLSDIRPGLVLPGRQKSVRELLASLPESDKVACLTSDWSS